MFPASVEMTAQEFREHKNNWHPDRLRARPRAEHDKDHSLKQYREHTHAEPTGQTATLLYTTSTI